MTYTSGFHLHLAQTGDRLSLQMSYIYPLSETPMESLETGSFTLRAAMCSDCLTILKLLEATSPAWRSQTVHIVPGRPPLSFRLCDPQDQAILQAIGILKKSST